MPTEMKPSKTLFPEHFPGGALYGNQEGIGWELSTEPFLLDPSQINDLHRLGPVLLTWLQAAENLYQQSLKGQMPAWVATLFEQGKPEGLVKFSQMKRLRKNLPLVIRPDLLITENGFTLCEIDAVPGGIGFTSSLNQAYRRSGFDVLESEEGMPAAFLAMLKAQMPEIPEPVIAIVLSDEAQDYRAEMSWLVDKIRKTYESIVLLHPRELDLVKDRLVYTDDKGLDVPIDMIYRFFELFDLPNIPKIELIQYAVKKGLVHCTPPFKPVFEEKLTLALLHHPVLEAYWQDALGTDHFTWLKTLVPQSWILDPRPAPPQSVIPGLTPGGRALQNFTDLAQLSQKERQLVIKPSGFSPDAWGSRGVTIGHDVSGEVWAEKLADALAAYAQTPYLLQKFEKPVTQDLKHLDMATGESRPFKGRTRLCPYYFLHGREDTSGGPFVRLEGVLATSCPADKKIIHGMKDAILAPCSQSPNKI